MQQVPAGLRYITNNLKVQQTYVVLIDMTLKATAQMQRLY